MALAGVIAGASLFGCGLSLEAYAEQVEEARVCVEGDECVLAGAGQCACLTAVNASEEEAINEAAMDLDCNGAQVECATVTNPRCEAGRCVADSL